MEFSFILLGIILVQEIFMVLQRKTIDKMTANYKFLAEQSLHVFDAQRLLYMEFLSNIYEVNKNGLSES
jgi:hypothetical protein